MDFEWQAQNFPASSSIPPKKKQKADDKIWDILPVIPTAKEQIPCLECFIKDAVVSWASNLNPEDNWDLHEGCQVVEFGGWPNVIYHHCKPLSPILTILELNGRVFNVYPLVLQGYLHIIHSDRNENKVQQYHR